MGGVGWAWGSAVACADRTPNNSGYGFGALGGYTSPSCACSLNGNVPTSSKDGGALRFGDVLDATAIDSTLKYQSVSRALRARASRSRFRQSEKRPAGLCGAYSCLPAP